MPARENAREPWMLLQDSGALSGVPPAALRDVLAVAEEQAFRAGDTILTQGERADGVLILREGSAYAWLRAASGDIRHLGTFSSGDIVGEMALVTGEPRSATVVARTDVRALLVRTADFERLASRHPQLAMVLTQLVADRLGRGAHDGFEDKIVEEFRILRCIGRGGMSVVYRASHEPTGELVALKMMSYRLIYDAPALARFRKEAELVQTFDHGNIARLKRLFPAYRTYFLVMELCDGVNLHQLLAKAERLTEVRVRPILGQLASALDYLHRRGVVHRDLKPANAMITAGGQVKLTDFGLAAPAASLEAEAGETENPIVGTPVFMAPEQLSGGRIDHRADVYALGCLAFQLLTGRHPFIASNLAALMQQKLSFQLPPADRIGDGVSAELHHFLRGALQPNPHDRPSSLEPLLGWATGCAEPPGDASWDLGPPPETTAVEPTAE